MSDHHRTNSTNENEHSSENVGIDAPIDGESVFSSTQLKNVVEALVMASDKPLSLEKLHALFELHEQPSKSQIKDAIAQLQMDYAGRGVQLVQVASGYRFQSVSDVSRYVARLWEERPQRYSRALLETLALIAYRQPITRGEIEQVRGVTVSSQTIKTMLEHNWVKVVGYKEVPGKPALYGTTKQFLDHFSLSSLNELPPLPVAQDEKISQILSEPAQLD